MLPVRSLPRLSRPRTSTSAPLPPVSRGKLLPSDRCCNFWRLPGVLGNIPHGLPGAVSVPKPRPVRQRLGWAAAQVSRGARMEPSLGRRRVPGGGAGSPRPGLAAEDLEGLRAWIQARLPLSTLGASCHWLYDLGRVSPAL